MKIIEGKEQEYADLREKNSDPYGGRCFTYAEDWADLMEAQMASGDALADCAKETSHKANTDGITGFMYGVAAAILSRCWIHGEEFRRWYNLDTQLGTEGEEANENGHILNPALLRIK